MTRKNTGGKGNNTRVNIIRMHKNKDYEDYRKRVGDLREFSTSGTVGDGREGLYDMRHFLHRTAGP